MASFTFASKGGLAINDQQTAMQAIGVNGLGLWSTITGMSIRLGGLSHTSPDDLDMLLLATRTKQNIEFWSDVGGGTDIANAIYYVSDGATAALPDTAAAASGGYKPADYSQVETAADFGLSFITISHPAPAGGTTFASAFAGLTPADTICDWQLYVKDDAGGDTGYLANWSLTFTTSDSYAYVSGTGGNDTLTYGSSTKGSGAYTFNGNTNCTYSGITYATFSGGEGDDTVFGSPDVDQLVGGVGRDTLYGKGGPDQIQIMQGDDVAGEIYDGGADVDSLDTLHMSGNAVFDFRDDTLASVETLYFFHAKVSGQSLVLMNASQFGSGFSPTGGISAYQGAGVAETLSITMGSVTKLDLSKLSILGFGDPDNQVVFNGDADAETMTGTEVRDTFFGGAGSDTFIVNNASDRVIEASGSGGGTDTVRSSVSYKLGAGAAVEKLETTDAFDTGPLNLFGNELAQTITGNDGANNLVGNGSDDVISARGGADGLQGGLGNDTLAGNGGNDGFYFNTALNAATNVDRILDFGQASGGSDLIRLDKAIFATLGTAGFVNADFFKANADGLATQSDDHILYSTTTGGLFYDTNGNEAGGRTQFATLTNFASLTGANALSAADFYVY